MTSSNPLTELALRCLRKAPVRDTTTQDAAARHDLGRVRAMSAAQRAAQLNEIMLMSEICGLPAQTRTLASGNDFRL
jgi:hypothetical protein